MPSRRKFFVFALFFSLIIHIYIILIFCFESHQTQTPSKNIEIIFTSNKKITHIGEDFSYLSSSRVNHKHSISALKYESIDESIFFESAKITQQASPVGEWFLHTEEWPLGTQKLFAVDVWVSADGQIVDWEILGEAVEDALIISAVQDIGQTLMNPAFSGSKAIASRITVEINVSRED